MAEFKLGRIKFIWKNTWTSSTTYYKDDVVRQGGSIYVCIKGHVSSSNFPTDESANWQKMAEGQEWKGDWQLSTYYKQFDIVKYNGYLYVCNTGHTSAALDDDGLEVDQAKWDLFTEGFDYRSDWTVNTKYRVNDLVKYNGIIYLCITAHVSDATEISGLEADQEKWETFSKGIFWRDIWATNVRYRAGDSVRYGGQLYVCNTGHTSAATDALGLEADQSKWDYFHKGIEYKGPWTKNTRYKINDLVKWGGEIWICTTYHTSANTTLTANEGNWAQFVEGLEFESSWRATANYQAGDVVTYGGYSYIAKVNNTNKIPTQSLSDWDLFTTGFRFLGDFGDDSTQQDYRVGDVVRVGGFTYVAIADSNGVRPPNTSYWERLNQGIEWNDAWVNSTYYDQGDAVRYGNNAYICIAEHTSDQVVAQNRPDQDSNGDFWNVLAGGPENTVMTTQGDMVYYGGAGPARLPIGSEGQVLVVNSAGNAPEWKYNGALNHIYYVSTQGLDRPAPLNGISLDQPWRSVRYATEQIENGPLQYGAKNLLQLNRSFIQAEVSEWVNYQIANPTGIWVGFTNDNPTLCYRDTGLIVDALAYDLSHGGNVKTREAALSYFQNNGNLITAIADEEEQLVEALGYALVVIDAVLSNVAPAANYQTLNGVGSPITQQINTDYTEESNSLTLCQSLMAVITDALTANSSAGIPNKVNPNNTLFVKTGEYEEVLPMIISENLAVVGDELRSTRIVPAPSRIDAADVPYSIAGLTHLQSIISDVITNTAVTPTTGNAESQVTSRPAGNAGSVAASTAVKDSADEILNILNNGVGSASALTFTDTGVTAKTTARTELQTNRATIISDLTSWISSNYGGLTYDVAKCERDTGYIVDALSYDIQYGGNWATTIMARHYYTGAVALLPTNEQGPTAAAYEQLKTIVANYMSGATEETEAAGLLDEIIDVINNGPSSIQTITYPSITWASADFQASHAALLDNRAEIAEQSVSWVEANYPNYNFDKATCERDGGYVVDALAYDMALGTNFMSVYAGISYFSSQAALVIAEQLDGEKGAVNFIKYKASIVSAYGAGAQAELLLGHAIQYVDYAINANGEPVEVFGTLIPNSAIGQTQAIEVLEANKDFLVAEVLAYIADTYPAYTYDTVACSKDVIAYIDALKHDLYYTGNYKTKYAARYYVNAVTGSQLEDMFYVRNGTGLRNCTLQGLNGTLGSANAYGTKRPTAGAFVSLDPGWGPDDERVWIINKSPYVQNVTTFGDGCIGAKIDGALHAGGNDSIVANDFTQVVSDGIGVWCTNLARVELVSVFSYYGHIGYLAENGGKIRATNGNSSYGDYGCVAEGVDPTEIPVTGQVNNRNFQAIIQNVFTDGNNILTFEYLNAGVNYTSGATTFTVTGEGFNNQIASVNTVDGAVFEVRLRDTNEEFGGADYVTTANSCQNGDTTSITLSNTDIGGSGTYIGMSIFITNGLGAGQYGYIDTYNAGTKVATIKKHSDDTAGWDHVVPGTAISGLLDATTTYTIEPRVTFSAPASGLYADTAKGRAEVEDGKVVRVKIWDPGQGYSVAPTITFTDPNNTVEVPTEVRIGDGVLTQPTWTNRGAGFTTAIATVAGDGYMDRYQPGEYIYVDNLSEPPKPGSNLRFAGYPDSVYKLVAVRNLNDEGGGIYSANIQVSPFIPIEESAEHQEAIEFRIRYSQVRLTGHDFLDIGTGNFTSTNYPGIPAQEPIPDNETVLSGGGRVFYTSTDQDGNFRVGDLFSVEQSTGIATLNADAFNISGLQELSLGELSLGGTGAVINEFSTDGTFTANSDSIVPTQKAIRTYITSQIGGGAATLNVNSVTAGQVLILGQEITTTTGNQITVQRKMNFTVGVDGVPVALNYYLNS